MKKVFVLCLNAKGGAVVNSFTTENGRTTSAKTVNN